MEKIYTVLLLVILVAVPVTSLHAQKYISKESMVSFFSEAPLENIQAENTAASSIFNLETGEIVFSVPIRGFKFPKSLMQKHFNENYMESEIYPKSTFMGKVTGYREVAGSYSAKATGELSIHGVTKSVEMSGDLVIAQGEITISTTFPVKLEDYNIKIPRILFSNIAEVVEVKVEFIYKPYVSN